MIYRRRDVVTAGASGASRATDGIGPLRCSLVVTAQLQSVGTGVLLAPKIEEILALLTYRIRIALSH